MRHVVVVDSREAVLKEAGDLLLAKGMGNLDPETFAELADATRSARCTPTLVGACERLEEIRGMEAPAARRLANGWRPGRLSRLV
jgi:hypothetical protein